MSDPESPAKKVSKIVRPLEPRDREIVRDICCQTAYRNKGNDLLFEDRQVHADYWTRYYTDFCSKDSWVVEHDGRVIGYFFGCRDHAHYQRIMRFRIGPSCFARIMWRWFTGQYKKPETKRYIRFMLFKAAAEAVPISFEKYPAHYHFNALAEGFWSKHYSQTTLMFLDRLEEANITHLHGFITEPKKGGMWRRFNNLYKDQKPYYFDERPTKLFEYVLGDETPMVNRAWGLSVSGYKDWITWLRDNYHV